ncbi:MAG TPA: DUF308 domain-containing protein [Ktedonobacteraceae bacterium]|nr:DUF308 domain-containing protein [Ktedonobacteraceae bacterium]
MQTFTSESMRVARRYWGMSLVRGIVAIIFGLLALLWPHLTFTFFVYVFGVFALVEGCILIASAFSQRGVSRRGGGMYQGDQNRGAAYQRGVGGAPSLLGITHTGWQTLLIEGIVTLAVGILCLVLPSFVGRLVVYAIAAWALFKGIGCLMQVQKRGWIMGVIGILAIILALILFFNPVGIIHSALWLIGLFALIMGVLLLVRGFQHNVGSKQETRPVEPTY